MDLRYHGAFPPTSQSVPGTITKPQDEEKQGQEPQEQTPLCLLQAWTQERDERTAYLFLLYDLQAPPYVVAKSIVRYFNLTPASGYGSYDFVGVTPPNTELLRPTFTRYNFKWEWQVGKYIKRGTDWVWQASGHSVVLPYSESELLASEETQYYQQLSELVGEVDHIALPQPKERLMLPVYPRPTVQSTPQRALEEKATSASQS
jgi:hypothetical protein